MVIPRFIGPLLWQLLQPSPLPATCESWLKYASPAGCLKVTPFGVPRWHLVQFFSGATLNAFLPLWQAPQDNPFSISCME